jgi:hypothetical protein
MTNAMFDQSADEPWLGVLAGQLAILATMWRGSKQISGISLRPAAQIAQTIFDADGDVSPDDLALHLTEAVSAVPGLAREGGPAIGAVVTTWFARHGKSLSAALDSLVLYYRDQRQAIRVRGVASTSVGRVTPGSLFEAVFFDWLRARRPLVLRQGVALFPALVFARARGARATERTRKLLIGLMKFRDDARVFAQQVAAFPDLPGVELRTLEGPFGIMADQLDAVLAPLAADFKTKGRPQDPLRPFEIRLLHEAGLSNGDISGLLKIKVDAVRKQLRKTRRKKSDLSASKS